MPARPSICARLGAGVLGLAAVAALALSAARAAEAPLADLVQRAAAEDPQAQYELGFQFETAGGVGLDFAMARSLFCRAARAGNAAAAYRLGRMYWAGLGLPPDRPLGHAWMSAAARSGDADAVRALGFLPAPARAHRASCSTRIPRRRIDGLPGGPPLRDLAVFRDLVARGAIAEMVRQLAPRFALDPDLVLAVIAVESNFQPEAVSNRNAQGLMQLIPETAARFSVKDPFDPVENVLGGMRYLRWLLAYFEGDVRLALAGYNAGEGAVDRHGGVPPFSETRAYVERVGRLFRADRQPFDPSATGPSPRLKRGL